ncbi:hypothetical protein [Aeromicrobium fastidiosum]|uniref:Uncharacterized protein n=1 Tax=Aeromicrobium fastidiosum TaxID=52699 RepID=A0A641APK9_9ACTN|nr:hypothetical protein [Aeromicrobium fastidiosum]KAA1379869.1 hypothetical protein ESP62_001260 [Aeromicrobium fastidiosum]MBP2389372.1 hypothetical protein [Aeromicrobium fastidiosum]
MTNAATALADLLATWNVEANMTAETTRGHSEVDPRDFWREQARAVELAHRVDSILRGMEAAGQQTKMFDASVVSWYEAVFTYTAPWKTLNSGGRRIVESARLENLQGLGLLLDQVGGIEISADERKSLMTVLEEAKLLVATDRSLSLESRRYIWSLIVEAQATLDEIDTFGDDPPRSILLELGGAMSLQADIAEGSGDVPTASRWRATRDQLVAGLAGGLGGQLALRAADGAQKAIESGLS